MAERYPNPNRYDRRNSASHQKRRGAQSILDGIRARLKRGEPEDEPDITPVNIGYRPYGSADDSDDGRIIRYRQSDVRRRPQFKPVWLLAVLAVAVLVVIFFTLNHNDAVMPPASEPDNAAAMANAPVHTPEVKYQAAPTYAPLPTQALPTQPLPPITTQTPPPQTSSSAGNAGPMLKYGSKGDDVKKLQGRLIELGYMALDTDDGAFGDGTLSALKSFQKVNGLTDDGMAGEKTLALLNGSTAKEDPDVFVWVGDKAKVYHTSKDCSDLKNPKQVKKSYAEKHKLKPCSKCK